MEIITSRQNPAIVAASKLGDKKYRQATHTFAFEGEKLLTDAILAGIRFVRVFATEKAYQRYESLLVKVGEDKLSLVSESVYEKLSFEMAPQGIFCVAEMMPHAEKGDGSFVLLLDGVSDPGNFGAVLRSADAFGVDTVYTGGGAADLYHPKVVRACMGSLFRVNVRAEEDLVQRILRLREDGFRIYATALDKQAEDIRHADFSGKIGFVIGNEGHGISDSVLAACSGCVIIPMRKGPQSLNAAVASGIVLWEAARGRMNIQNSGGQR